MHFRPFFLSINLVSAQNDTNITNQTNITFPFTLIPSDVLDCPKCLFIRGEVSSIPYYAPYSFSLGFTNCSMTSQQGLTLNDSKWVQVCEFSWNITSAQQDSVILPYSVLKNLKLENITQILSENESLKTGDFWKTILLGLSSSGFFILFIWFFYNEYWIPAHEEKV